MRSFIAVRVGASAMLALALVTPRLGAQAPDARWQPWLGCWSTASVTTGASSDNMVCVLQGTTVTSVRVAVVAGGKVQSTEVIEANGERIPKTVEQCPGWESASWSADGRRLMVRSEFKCGAAIVSGSSILAITPVGDWIEVRGTKVGEGSRVRAVRYRPAGLMLDWKTKSSSAEPDVLELAPQPMLGVDAARLAAGIKVSADAVLEVVEQTDAPVAEAWLTELGQRFDLRGKELVRLADAGMPSRMIDLMVALSYPERFAVRRPEDAGGRGDGGMPRQTTAQSANNAFARNDLWRCDERDYRLDYGYRADLCDRGVNRYGIGGYYDYRFGYGGLNGYSYDPYGSYYYYGARPVVIVPSEPDGGGSGGSSRARGQAVKGQGYRRTDDQPVRAAGGGSANTSPSSSTSSPASSSSSGSSGSSGEGARTAKPRIPPR